MVWWGERAGEEGERERERNMERERNVFPFWEERQQREINNYIPYHIFGGAFQI